MGVEGMRADGMGADEMRADWDGRRWNKCCFRYLLMGIGIDCERTV